MGVKLGSVLTKTCQPIETGVLFRLFELDASKALKITTNPFKSFPPKESEKQEYSDFEKTKKIEICDMTNFAKKHTLLRMQVKLKGKGCETYNLTIFLQYSEGISPTNFYESPLKQFPVSWPTESSHSNNYATDSIGDHFGFQSSGIGTANLKMEAVDPDPNSDTPRTIKLTATLVSLGTTYDFLSGTPEVQIKEASEPNFQNGFSLEGFWTGLSFKNGPIGLVMSLNYRVIGVCGDA